MRNARYSFEDIIGVSNKLMCCKEKAIKAAKTSSPVLIYGETGTGKELFVQSIHNESSRNNKPFIAQNCAAIPSNLLESILFGTVKGSFTGSENRKGLFEIADGGTLYLDELNSMPIELQSKILRALQEGVVSRVGSNALKRINVRIIASSNESPELLLKEGKLRRDLYYRLNVVRIDIPALRDRKEDITILVDHFIRKFNDNFNAKIEGIEQSAMEKLILWNWGGNVRELEHTIEGLFNLKLQGVITLNDLKEIGFNKKSKIIPLKQKMNEFEKSYILEVLIITKFNISKAAELLNVPRQTLQSKIKRLNIK